jgi:hypothetical protein
MITLQSRKGSVIFNYPHGEQYARARPNYPT